MGARADSEWRSIDGDDDGERKRAEFTTGQQTGAAAATQERQA